MKTNTTNIVAIIVGIGVILSVMFFAISAGRLQIANGSVSVTDEYSATTTSTGTFATSQLIKTGYGSLGSIVITGAAAGQIVIYDATTTDVNKRTGNKATSTIRMADVPASAAAGTYTFDTAFSNGMLVEIGGTMPTTTITFR